MTVSMSSWGSEFMASERGRVRRHVERCGVGREIYKRNIPIRCQEVKLNGSVNALDNVP